MRMPIMMMISMLMSFLVFELVNFLKLTKLAELSLAMLAEELTTIAWDAAKAQPSKMFRL